MSLDLGSDDVLRVFSSGQETFKSMIWFVENCSTVVCVIGILLTVLMIARGAFPIALGLFFFTLIVGVAPKIASIFFF